MSLKILALNCTLKQKGTSSTDRILSSALAASPSKDVSHEIIRVSEWNVLAGVTSDEGEGDDWPMIRRKLMDADILLIGTPIWLGQPSSIAKRVLERMDAFLDEADKKGRTPAYGKVANVLVVGNEDGAHHVSAEIYQALADVGFTIPAGGPAYWVGEAMGDTDFKDLDEIPERVSTAIAMLMHNTLHLARLLKAHAYPGYL